jgi:hypothetical protein
VGNEIYILWAENSLVPFLRGKPKVEVGRLKMHPGMSFCVGVCFSRGGRRICLLTLNVLFSITFCYKMSPLARKGKKISHGQFSSGK